MIDIVLTRTQRKTPTVIHPGYKITRIRNFYMRKVKFTQQTINEKLGAALQEFPKLDDIHPFYADLMNILYDRDHFKLALGQINTAKNLIAGLAKDYLRLLKYGDSLYRCKQLKRAALGRMCTVIKKLKASLGYLEEVRKHISRLPALDPNTRTLLLTGYPNVGKSSFMNKVTRADVEVQPYAFTTKALFVGHMDHRFLRWQVVDTPGILDRPLEERNTIEMQAITALAHLQCCVLYFLDVSEQCGYTLESQLKLFESIRPLFANKQVMIVANKTDVIPYEKLSADVRARIEEVALKAGAEVVPMSNVSEENISTLKTTACDKLLEARVDSKLSLGKVKDDVLSRITVAQPKPRDNAKRGASIPDSVAAKASAMNVADSGRVTEKQLMWNNGGPGVYVCDYRKYYQLEDDEWRFDTIPEFMDGKNVVDFFDPEIEERLNALDAEEAELEAQGAYTVEDEDESDIDEEDMLLYEAIKEKQTIARAQSHQTKTNIPKKFTLRGRSAEDIEEQLENVGLPSEGVVDSTRGRKRERSQSRGESVSMSIDPKLSTSQVRGGGRSKSSTGAVSKRARSQSATRGPTEHSVAPHQRKQVVKKQREVERHLFKHAKSGESDREYYPKMVKHLNSGKRSLGTSTIGR
jgi:nucleolar GTP-binding protein